MFARRRLKKLAQWAEKESPERNIFPAFKGNEEFSLICTRAACLAAGPSSSLSPKLTDKCIVEAAHFVAASHYALTLGSDLEKSACLTGFNLNLTYMLALMAKISGTRLTNEEIHEISKLRRALYLAVVPETPDLDGWLSNRVDIFTGLVLQAEYGGGYWTANRAPEFQNAGFIAKFPCHAELRARFGLWADQMLSPILTATGILFAPPHQ
ncbi:hypothetical protein [Verrucomicrobium spinosum]|uniref:hypothetical protein n=1 Tax=Verrucomicrobium spinosum TaxID=2736 RepID=UPI0001744C73|nr:hypothetical protein [Verrucomicrobium spinosum]